VLRSAAGDTTRVRIRLKAGRAMTLCCTAKKRQQAHVDKKRRAERSL
jgi:hypothetical protein